jgi:uncharacterized protein (TIGR04255 family)
MALPKSITPCPIIDSIIEVRFSSSTHPNAVFGLIYNELHKDFGEAQNLPILQLPETLRNADPNLKFKPHYRLSNGKFTIQIGPDVLSISSNPEYAGWTDFSKVIFEVLNRVETISIIEKISRIGIRYINFFDCDIFQNIDLNIKIGKASIPYKNTIFRTEIEQKEYFSSLQVANNASLNEKTGSLIDIDTFRTEGLDNFFKQKEELIHFGHEKEKELFFGLLKQDFLESLNPIF